MGRWAVPLSLDVVGRRCVVVGGGPVALSRAERLAAAGAEVAVFATAPEGGVVALAAAGRVALHRRGVEATDLDGTLLVVATGEQPVDAEALWCAARQRGALVNVVDDVEHCTVAQPAVVERGDLRIAISTGGRAPALAKALRRRFEREFGPEWGLLVDLLNEVRRSALPRRVPFDVWAGRWEQALGDPDLLAARLRWGDAAAVRRDLEARVAPQRLHRATGDSPRPGYRVRSG